MSSSPVKPLLFHSLFTASGLFIRLHCKRIVFGNAAASIAIYSLSFSISLTPLCLPYFPIFFHLLVLLSSPLQKLQCLLFCGNTAMCPAVAYT